MNRFFAFIALATLPMAGAGAMAPRPKVADPKLASCGADKVKSYVGKPATPEVRTAVGRISGAERARWIEPGMMVTMDYHPNRLNARLGSDGRIGSFTCG